MIKLCDKLGNLIADITENSIEYIVEEERNGLFELKLIYPAGYNNYNDLIKENILITNATNTLLNQKFRIYNIRKTFGNKIEVYARHISYDLLSDFIENLDIENQSCEYCLNQLFSNSQFSRHFKGVSDIVNAQDFKVSRSNPLNAIAGQRGSIIDTFGTGAEILRDNETIKVLNRRGHDNGIVIEYGENMTGFDCEEDTTNLITRIYPYVKKNNNNTEDIITLTERFVDSPRINNYSHPYIASIDLSDKFEQDEEITQSKLRLETEKYFIKTKCDIPKINFKINFVLIKKLGLNLCDLVTIKHKLYGIDTQAKVIKAVYNPCLERYISMELGEPKASLGDLISSGGSNNSGNNEEENKPPIIDDNNFPNTLPNIPILSGKAIGLGSIELTWTFENKVYYSYQLFASKDGDSKPNMFDLIFEGQGSSFLHQVKTEETWYYWVRGLNSYGRATELSEKVEVTTLKKDDFEEYFSSLAVENLVTSIFSVDYMEAGIIKGNWIDAKQLSVTDGNGKRTLDIDSFGNVNLDVKSLKISSKDVETVENVSNKINSVKETFKSVNLINNSTAAINLDCWSGENGNIQRITSSTIKNHIGKVHYFNLSREGDFQLIQDGDTNIVIDCGYDNTTTEVINYLKAQNVTKIDLFISTHFHADHIGGFSLLADTFYIKEALYKKLDTIKIDKIEPESEGYKTKKLYNDFLEKCREKCINYREFKNLESIRLSDYSSLRIHNVKCDDYSSYNNVSIAVLYNCFGKKVLLSGDMTHTSEQYTAGEYGKIDVLKAGHHCYDRSVSERFLNEVNPIVVVATTPYVGSTSKKKCIGTIQWKGKKLYDTGTNGTMITTITSTTIGTTGLKTNFLLTNTWWHRKTVGDFEEWVWFQGDGSIAKNKSLTINNKLYHFNSTGICKNPKGEVV